ncbi:menaquinone biosynthesis decarboxylase [Konateibacter massiliensis]|uniref:menaquinone biosynthesis decarboxylase n=1 Tax=Konateibacter massiliensis TaxID=2002841 RepID=UPI000C14D51D|nr:menaquinone biosynthesis decarboxylase [Konateibacter massiliensis]
MAYRDLQSFLTDLEAKGELKRIKVPVSPELEITEIADRVSKSHGPALLFQEVKGSKYPVVMNAMGSYKRMSMALGAENLDDIGEEIARYLNFEQYFSISGLVKSIPRFFRLLHVFPHKSFRRGKCQQVIEREPDLFSLPVLKCWPEDAGRFFTLPLVFTKEAGSRRQNVGMYRMQILDRTSTGMHWHKHKDGSKIFASYAEKGQKMPVSVALGCDPAITYAATAPLPKEIDEMMLAGWLRKKGVKLVKSVTNDIYVPADAEFILEGYVDPTEELVLEGPFGDHTGYYSLADFYPRFHVTCITHKREAVYPATVVGKPPMEDCYMAKATERIFLPLLQMQIPELVDLNLPLEGVFHNCAIVSVKNNYPGAARKVMNAMWGMGQMMYTKLIVAVDETVDVQNLEKVKEAVLKNVKVRESLFFCEGPLDALDHSSGKALYGCRLGVDATKNNLPAEEGLEDTIVILPINKTKDFEGKQTVTEYMGINPEKFVICVDNTVDPKDSSTVMWKVFNNIDAGRDLVILGQKIGIDATRKLKSEGLTREWPNDIEMTEEMKRAVTERWTEYGID